MLAWMYHVRLLTLCCGPAVPAGMLAVRPLESDMPFECLFKCAMCACKNVSCVPYWNVSCVLLKCILNLPDDHKISSEWVISWSVLPGLLECIVSMLDYYMCTYQNVIYMLLECIIGVCLLMTCLPAKMFNMCLPKRIMCASYNISNAPAELCLICLFDWDIHDTYQQAHMIHISSHTWYISAVTHDTYQQSHMIHISSHTWYISAGTHDTYQQSHMIHISSHTIHISSHTWYISAVTHDTYQQSHMIHIKNVSCVTVATYSVRMQ